MELRPSPLPGALFLLLVCALPCSAVDWAAFDDPESNLLVVRFAASIEDLTDEEKAAAFERLAQALNSSHPEIRRRAALALGHFGDQRGVPAMIDDLVGTAGKHRDHVIVALRILNDKRAIPALRKALDDRSPYVRGIALAALGELKAAKAYDQIVAHTTDKAVPPAGAKTLHCVPTFPAQNACYALGQLGDKRAVPVLIKRLSDKQLQNSARQALEALTGQKLGNDPQKWRAWWAEQQ